ncbi:MAG: polysaccharide biosynthesis/export family protein [Muribaculaceae bacterium]|nr:polysaccharide biosynthesis/export family protein [Muribaculaceae bacterium]
MNFKLLLAGFLVATTMVSCHTPKTSLPYFSDIATVKEGKLAAMEYMPVIQPDDELYINVSSNTPGAIAMYNMPMVNPTTRALFSQSTSMKEYTYIVSSDGDINFPMLGNIHVAGMTTEALAELLTQRISKTVTDPRVSVQLMNFQVNVAGEVKNPGQISVPRNRVTILDALSAAGDLTEYGERSNVLIIREENGERKYAHVDLNSSDLLNSPYYYLQQNDYIYVEPNKIRQDNSKYNQNNAFKLSVTSTIVSAASVIASLVIALTVK